MEGNSKVITLMSPTSFISEIMLILMGLSGISLTGVSIGYFYALSFLFVGLGLSFGILTSVICMIGVYILLYLNYRCLKMFITALALFIGLQLASIIHLYFFTNNIDITEQEQGLIITLDVCFGVSASALVALCFHLKQKGSTVDMVKL
ncbi:unnamed protein product [Adineta steineri]|uniref:Uncharacterized protein n=2 Tax=Adineta steineri TaxID=433720 RepID=A0A818QUR8_9BILA|nr:unnamed protein product [Adineta steineri]CAF1328540.1 unnamed protein product [Adineta steineri]CAF1499856.1 unnamed protein product [Adineta steineri]CAF3559044.1 unnamed protein product [Adineta steineri]CAF3640067.1 unnamed protein product [Adineta steineri]